MNFANFNKATASVVVGSIVTVAGAFLGLDPEVQGALQTVLTALFVYVVANRPKTPAE